MPSRPITRGDSTPAPGPSAGQADRSPAPAPRSPLASLPLVLTIPEVARVLRIRKQRAYELVASGALPSTRLGPRCVRVIRADLEDFLTDQPSARAKSAAEDDQCTAGRAQTAPPGFKRRPAVDTHNPASDRWRPAGRS